MAARSIWNGTITFGMVNVPVKLYTATEPKPVPDLMEALQRTLENVRAGEDPRSGNDGGEDLSGLSREELYERAQREKIPGRTKMSKKQLVEALSGD